MSKDQKLNALKEVPSFLEMTSQIFYLPSYFTGPQHSMSKFRSFIQRNIDDGDMTGSKRFSGKRFTMAWVYFGIHIIFSSIVSIYLYDWDTSIFNDQRFYFLLKNLCNFDKFDKTVQDTFFQAPVDYITTKEFQSMPFWKMSFYFTIWVKGILAKYIGAWLLAEGAVILSGKSHLIVAVGIKIRLALQRYFTFTLKINHLFIFFRAGI